MCIAGYVPICVLHNLQYPLNSTVQQDAKIQYYHNVLFFMGRVVISCKTPKLEVHPFSVTSNCKFCYALYLKAISSIQNLVCVMKY
jgi:hypothetical protein